MSITNKTYVFPRISNGSETSSSTDEKSINEDINIFYDLKGQSKMRRVVCNGRKGYASL